MSRSCVPPTRTVFLAVVMPPELRPRRAPPGLLDRALRGPRTASTAYRGVRRPRRRIVATARAERRVEQALARAASEGGRLFPQPPCPTASRAAPRVDLARRDGEGTGELLHRHRDGPVPRTHASTRETRDGARTPDRPTSIRMSPRRLYPPGAATSREENSTPPPLTFSRATVPPHPGAITRTASTPSSTATTGRTSTAPRTASADHARRRGLDQLPSGTSRSR